MYFIRGSLPWQGLKVNKKEDRYKKICEKKKETSAKDLCAGFPSEFETFVTYTRNLQFTEVPNYNYLKNLLKTILKKTDSLSTFLMIGVLLNLIYNQMIQFIQMIIKLYIMVQMNSLIVTQ